MVRIAGSGLVRIPGPVGLGLSRRCSLRIPRPGALRLTGVGEFRIFRIRTFLPVERNGVPTEDWWRRHDLAPWQRSEAPTNPKATTLRLRCAGMTARRVPGPKTAAASGRSLAQKFDERSSLVDPPDRLGQEGRGVDDLELAADQLRGEPEGRDGVRDHDPGDR